MKLFKIFISAILAGILIGIGGAIYVVYSDSFPFFGALLFSFGLFTIIMTGLHLYTGKVGYVFENKPSYLLELLIMFIGNTFGAVLVGRLLNLTRYINKYKDDVLSICDVKMGDNLASIFVLSFFCGVLIFLAVDVSKKLTSGFQKTFAITVPVIIFILCGFEHVIANIFYFSLASVFNFDVFIYILVMAVGNAVGSICIWGIGKLINLKPKSSDNQ